MRARRPVPAGERAQIWHRLGIPADYARTRRLPVQREARSLVSIGHSPAGRILKLAPRAAAAWTKLNAAAATAGIHLQPISGFRSMAYQAGIIRRRLARGERLDDILHVLAAPGCSEHHTGRALDLATTDDWALEERFARTRAFRWLVANARRFGFHLSYPKGNRHGIVHEPWHWCWKRSRNRG